jgi:hypothetical protein
LARFKNTMGGTFSEEPGSFRVEAAGVSPGKHPSPFTRRWTRWSIATSRIIQAQSNGFEVTAR